ncbi:MAG: hypothetical protein KGZ38_07645 [Erysipelothrix sp.]|jgi:hypothetical protein|nr:hypothetical protein [Erysipelothrix sp.]
MNDSKGLDYLKKKLDYLTQYEQCSLTMKEEPVDTWETLVDRKGDLIAKINQVNFQLSYYPIESEEATFIRQAIQAKMSVIQTLDQQLMHLASEARESLVNAMRNNNQSRHIAQYVANTQE